MSQYQLIAFDMDGTLLNSNKQISPETLNAINGQPMQEKRYPVYRPQPG